MRRFLRENGLSVVLFALFLAFMAGHAVTGWRCDRDERREHGEPAIAFAAYLRSADFWSSEAENWESEFLQMAALVLLTAVLRQRGSPESKDPDGGDPVDAPDPSPAPPSAPWPVRVGGWARHVYAHSLSLALTALFLASFAIHAVASARAANEDRLRHGEPPVGVAAHLAGARFWYESFQNWQSEFLAVGVLVVLTVFLRQRGSAQSKPVAAPHAANE